MSAWTGGSAAERRRRLEDLRGVEYCEVLSDAEVAAILAAIV